MSDSPTDLMDELNQVARANLIKNIQDGALALPAIKEHERICALRWRWVQRLLVAVLSVQLLQVLGVPAQKIGLAAVHFFIGGG